MAKVQYINLKIDELHVNKNNYRHEPKQSEAEAISYFFSEKKDITALLKLCKSFVDNGYFPDSTFLVCKNEDDEYYALDGNRRLTCLKILENPQLVPNTDICKSLKNFVDKNSENFDPPILSCFLYENENEAADRIRMLHSNSSNLDQRWTQIQQYRFDSKNGIKVPLWFNIIESNDPSLFNEIKNTSTLERIIINKYVDQFLPIDYSTYKFIDNKSLIYFKQIINDITNSAITSRSVNTTTQIEAYLNRVVNKDNVSTSNNNRKNKQNALQKNESSQSKDQKSDNTKQNDNPKSNDSNKNENHEEENKTTTRVHSSSTSIPKKSMFLKDLNVSNISLTSSRYVGLIDIINETKSIDYKRFPIAAAMLSRTLLDQSLRYFAEEHSLPNKTIYFVEGKGADEKIKNELGLEKVLKEYLNAFNNPSCMSAFSLEFKTNFNSLFVVDGGVDVKESRIKIIFDYSVHHPHIMHANPQELENFSNNGFLFLINYLLNE